MNKIIRRIIFVLIGVTVIVIVIVGILLPTALDVHTPVVVPMPPVATETMTPPPTE